MTEPNTMHVAFSHLGTIRKWSPEPFVGSVAYACTPTPQPVATSLGQQAEAIANAWWSGGREKAAEALRGVLAASPPQNGGE